MLKHSFLCATLSLAIFQAHASVAPVKPQEIKTADKQSSREIAAQVKFRCSTSGIVSFELFKQGDMLNAISGYINDATDCPQRQESNHRQDHYPKLLETLRKDSFAYAERLKKVHATHELVPQNTWDTLRQFCYWNERSFGQKLTIYKDDSTRYSGTVANKDEFTKQAKTLLETFKEMQEERALCFKPITQA